MMISKIIPGDCIDVLKTFSDNYFDSIVTDPPYGISFMNKHWDYNVPKVEVWKEVLRVLKPGGHILCACGMRTQHRMTVNIEDAGFEIRDIIAWIYGSGFPKSLNIGEGWGTALKPAMELWTLARKPLSEKTVAGNVLKYGTGGINIDGCRIALNGEQNPKGSAKRVYASNEYAEDKIYGKNKETSNLGRFPANVILDGSEEVISQLPNTKSGLMKQHIDGGSFNCYGKQYPREVKTIGDNGSASRFFYCAKASPSERNKGLEDFEDKFIAGSNQAIAELKRGNEEFEKKDENSTGYSSVRKVKNNHPTVKPVSLMKYLCKLITPVNGVVLDPFMGSGSTGIACKLENFNFVGIEKEKQYCIIARARIKAW
jgi:site-specific DNA-methyltransferase (adenine-specific)